MEPKVGMNLAKRMTGATLAVGWFVFLFLAAISVATVTLSASQLQSRLLTLSSTDAPISVWQVERLRKEWSKAQAEIDALSEQVASLRIAANAAQAALNQARLKHSEAAARYVKSVNEIVARLQLYAPLEIPKDYLTIPDHELRATIAAIVASLATKLEAANKKLVDDLQAAYVDALRETSDLWTASQLADAGAQNAQQRFEAEQATLSTAIARLDTVINPDGKLSSGDIGRIYDLISEFDFMEGFALGTLYRFSILPNDFLVIVLVLAMGVLGSTLQLTYDYYRNGGVQKTSMFFLRPMLGAITALVVFVLLKAGVLVVTDSSKLGAVAPLNPFFIAFVGIASGLLSENALETVRSIGQSWFRGSGTDQAPRWASGVKPLITDTKTLDDLASRTGIDIALLQKWIDEEEPVPIDGQRLLAAWLDRDRRTLFTDIPPSTAS